MAYADGRADGAAAVLFEDVRPQRGWLVFLYVVPGSRRRGIGSRLWAAVEHEARVLGRERILASTVVGDTAGERFVRRLGGRPGLIVELNRCPTARLDPGQLRAWCDRAAERASGYSLVAFDDICPDQHLDAFVDALPIMNTAPRSEPHEDFAPTREQLQEMMAALVREGTASWTLCARDDRTGRFAGYTQLFFPAHRPWLAAQGDTGVHPDDRNRGLGRWLKAHNALRLLAERPDVEFIETSNASANDAMLSINRAMGFATVARWQQWDLTVS